MVVGLILCAVLVAVAAATWEFPGLAAVARSTEAKAGLGERLSTALEFGADASQPRTPVGRALIDDAEAIARQINPATLQPVVTRSTLVAALVVVLTIVGWQVVPPPGVGALSPAAVPEVAANIGTPSVGGAATIEDIRLMAELLEAESQRRDEDTLGNVASQLRALVNDAGRSLTQEELNAAFSRLVEEAAVGFGNEVPGWMPRQSGDISQIGRQMAEYESRLAEQRRLNQEYADENLNTILKTLEERAAAGESSLLVTGAREFDAGAAGQRTDSSGEGGMSLEQLVAMDMATTEAPPGSSMSEGGAPESGTAMPAGASEEATGGGGEAAGLGSQELGEGDEGFTRLPSPAENDMILTAAEVDHGARIRMLIAPETTAESGATLDASAEYAGQSNGSSSRLQLREQVGMGERRAVARYFSPWGETGLVEQ